MWTLEDCVLQAVLCVVAEGACVGLCRVDPVCGRVALGGVRT